MSNGKPVTDLGEVGRRKEEKKSNLFWPIGIAVAIGLVFAGIFSFALPNLQQQPAMSGTSDAGTKPQQPVPPAVTPVPTATETPTTTKVQEPVATVTPKTPAKEIPIELPMTVSPDINRADLKLSLFYTGDNPLIKGYVEYPYLKEKETLSIVLLKDGKQVEGYALPQKNFPFGFLRGSQVDIAEIKNHYTIWVKVK